MCADDGCEDEVDGDNVNLPEASLDRAKSWISFLVWRSYHNMIIVFKHIAHVGPMGVLNLILPRWLNYITQVWLYIHVFLARVSRRRELRVSPNDLLVTTTWDKSQLNSDQTQDWKSCLLLMATTFSRPTVTHMICVLELLNLNCVQIQFKQDWISHTFWKYFLNSMFVWSMYGKNFDSGVGIIRQSENL